ncbi:MAG: long-chain-fatty-acid--CoA ligase [Proteobacteria bacterium]|nr:long-chain-fatty-acid--CoA ligase [Pseudomonadota bacterium]MBU4468865.1 long-chain-fatty-acid--CoA ligase [Pseudomonadota bacterium]MCG2750858.1 long-chain-fatty-acid--CoA ligase [Desulfobacteraceae bacterium]
MNITIRDILNKIVQRHGDREILVFQEARFTGRQYVERVYRLGNALLGLGLKKGDRVALLLNNSNFSAECFRGANSAGLPFVSLNARNAVPEHIYILNDSGAKALIVGEEFLPMMDKILPGAPDLEHVIVVPGKNKGQFLSYEDLLAKAPSTEPDIEITAEDPYSIRYTSGTTGKPKGVLQLFRSDITQLYNALMEGLEIQKSDVVALTAPVTHASGSQIMPHMAKGAKVVIMSGFDSEDLLKTIEKEKITTLYLVPTMIVMLINHPTLKNYNISTIRTIRYGASPIAPNVLKKAIGIFGDVFLQGYGLTEASMPLTLLTKEDHRLDGSEKSLKRLKSIGREVLIAKVSIQDPECRILPDGQTGEICVKSDQVMKEYWNNPEATRETLVDGWLHTGDMGYRDEDGYLYLVDRKKDMIISGGFNIYPREVEDALYMHESVLEAAVVGVPDEKWGETVMAFVVLKENKTATEAEIIAHCREQLASYKKPTSVKFLNELPKNANGKMLKKDLKAPYWVGQWRAI